MVGRLGVDPASGLSGSRGLYDVIRTLSFSLLPRYSLLGGPDGTGQHKAHLGPG